MFYGGIADMVKVPDAVFVIDTHLERLAVDEARDMHIPVVGITDTNADPTIINYPIPANDDAVGSVQLIVHHIVDAWIEGKKQEEAEKQPVMSEKKEVSTEKKLSERIVKKESKEKKTTAKKTAKKVVIEEK